MTLRTTRKSTGWIIGGVAVFALIVAAGIWAYPELRRTIQMHSM